ncbi:uncharacterized protein LOC124361350 [Homalodisca vitripennis]|uniref:uncharacterized protein LOC124361350 n=1 Tax=Homalodisca vitripennis TaxID=197043 RepID=UPI001EEA0979|nr:uncharacterized protein LOC124361350 [Homalodisca vitripennis]
MFADDVKVFRAVRNPSDTERLQMNLCLIENWCITNAMSINAAKCSLVSFTRSAQTLVVSDYVLNGTVLSRSTIVRDLGVVFSADLSPDKHIDFICGKALRMLNFILRASRGGLGIVALNILYKSLVRSILEYCSVVWSPYQHNHIERLDRIQRRFVRAVGVRLGHNYFDVPIELVEASLGLLPLSTRRQQADALFLWGVLRGTVDCPDLLCRIDLRASRLTRSCNLFFGRSHPTNYIMHGPLPRLHRLGNQLCRQFDFFDDSQSVIRGVFQSRVPR